ncbi:IclR family transcriptional regulator [Paraburkholderia silvatlantica]|uniref:DNA-binding IclR family transcriptional regulator n=1 Tax=Paraburkholderia silvatlantica TaxID=321895 RepID=A0ABR6FGT7_9BURK|nr:IclR family transcriptional regulator [Paraburkholderia silvatlantica]MBB2926641.1 DNA-binding IclR family transcriptional regulator [Paraburkholderia silvatlantica]PVY37725.1 IclR family transcriptional regulator [Paraburkholderia silvatlantica]PXW42688.1 IclR family transcriptional regulator [Paraburkholderia silvatlantica]
MASIPTSEGVAERRETESGALARGLTVLSRLHEAARPLSLQEIADSVGLPTTTCHRLLQSLDQAGYVYREGALYCPTPRAACPLPLEHPLNRLRRDTAPLMRELQERHGPSVLLIAFLGNHRVTVDSVAGSYSVAPYFDTNVSAPLHASVSGKILLSDRTPEQRDLLLGPEPFAARTELTIRDRSVLYAELEQVHQRGWATNENENVMGISAVGTRLAAPSGRALGAIVLTGPSRFFCNGNEAMRDDLRQASELLNTTSHAVRAMSQFLGI